MVTGLINVMQPICCILPEVSDKYVPPSWEVCSERSSIVTKLASLLAFVFISCSLKMRWAWNPAYVPSLDLPPVSGSQGELGKSQKVTNLREGWRTGDLEYGHPRPRSLSLQPPTGFSPYPIFHVSTGDSLLFVTYLTHGWKLLKLPTDNSFLRRVHRFEGHGIWHSRFEGLWYLHFLQVICAQKWENQQKGFRGFILATM